MARAKEPTRENVNALIAELDSFVDNFNVEDPEDVQIRKDVLITAMDAARLLSVKGGLRGLRFQQANRRLHAKPRPARGVGQAS
jgi:hypothetical protein